MSTLFIRNYVGGRITFATKLLGHSEEINLLTHKNYPAVIISTLQALFHIVQ